MCRYPPADFADLVDMVSISTLFAFWIVALALIWNRYYKEGESPRKANYIVAGHMFVLVAASVGEWLLFAAGAAVTGRAWDSSGLGRSAVLPYCSGTQAKQLCYASGGRRRAKV